MSRDVLTVGSTMRIPLLFWGEYSQWNERFMNYLEEQTDEEAMINLIKNGDQPLPTITQVSIAGATSSKQPPLKDKSMWSAQEKKIRKIDRLARSLFIQGLPNNIYSVIDHNKTAKDLWYALERHMLGFEYGDVNDAIKSKKKVVVITSDLLALLAEQKKTTSSANMKQEYVKYDDKKEEKKVDEKKRDMSKVKCYNCKKEAYFAKDCKKAKREKVLSDSEKSSSSLDDTIAVFVVIFVQDKMSRDVLTVGSTMRIPLLFFGEYSQWNERFMNYLEEQTDEEAMINLIKNGDQPLPTVTQVSIAGATSSEQPHLKDKSMWSDQEKKIRKIDRLARSLFIQGLPNDIYSVIDHNKTAKDLWDALERHMLGFEYGEQDRKAAVLYKYETFKATEGELTSSATSSANMKQEYVKYDDKKEEKKVDEKKRDMSKVKCYNCKKEAHFAKDYKKAKDHAWMESSSDSDQGINANMLFIAQREKVLSDSEKSSSSLDDTIAEQTSSLKPYVSTVILEWIIIDLEDEVIVQIYLWIIDFGCSKHMTGNRVLLMNFGEKFLGTVRFRNNDFTVIAGYGDVVIGSMTIKKVYYVEGLCHNLFSVGQFCNNGLEFAFQKSTCFIRNENGVDFLTSDHSLNLYTIALNDIASNSSNCLSAKASSSQSWLWHQCLSHLNFATINNLVKNNLVRDNETSTPNVETFNTEGEVFHEVSESFQGESSSSSINDDVQQSSEEVIVPQTNNQSISNDMISNVNDASLSHNVFNERLEDAYFDISTTFLDSSDIHTFHQHYPYKTKWTKDQPLHKIIGDPKSNVRTRGQLANSCLFACLLSSIEPANVAEALKDADWVNAM
nr:integrase, catalytic region, zinc finger, CCHC-type, peptidase aspartic, catalytic [Tanacetum cinerariifolium]